MCAGGDAPALKTTVVRGLHVVRGIADQQGGGRFRIEFAEHMSGQFRLRLDPWSVTGAVICLEQLSESKVVANPPR